MIKALIEEQGIKITLTTATTAIVNIFEEKKNEERPYSLSVYSFFFGHYKKRCLICFQVTVAMLESQTNSHQIEFYFYTQSIKKKAWLSITCPKLEKSISLEEQGVIISFIAINRILPQL